ncbi:MAG: hypothetical protein NTW96_18895 [Planctomycetia bacterium]|nr:hypothetical protein [Planctomycetia bacterium]
MRCRHVYARWILVAVVLAGVVGPVSAADEEPNYQTAAGWWKELPKKWTPVGWRNHLFRYNVLYSGAVVAKPDLSLPSRKPATPGIVLWPSVANPVDDGTVVQGWRTDHDAPVLWTDWSGSPYDGAKQSGLRPRQEIFAHVPGAADVKTGVEPLFAWARMSVARADAKADAPRKHTFSCKIFAPDIGLDMDCSKNLRYVWTPYPHGLALQSSTSGGSAAMLVEPDGKVRLAVIAAKGCRPTVRVEDKIAVLEIELDLQQTDHVDLLIPMIAYERQIVERECSLGYDKALAEADAYWRQCPATAATIDVPEEEISRAIRAYLKMAEVVAEKNPTTGEYSSLTGSWMYADICSTPNSMTYGMLLDPMGYHAAVERYLAIFKRCQGQRVPPGKVFKPHPGYLGTPNEYTSTPWVSDNGALLWAMARHGLLSRDAKYIEEYTPTIVKSCEWIRDARRITGHGGIEGILPPGWATDERQSVQSSWNDGWNYLGLTTAVLLLERIKHPRAAEFEAEARDYRERFRAVFAEVAQKTPTWTDAAGKTHAIAPRSLSGDEGFGAGKDAFYLDCGPLFLVFAGLMDPEDELIRASRLWFREGPPRKTYQDNGDPAQPPSLEHEMSSCEPCYSWVYFHSWRQGDRAKFLEGMYSLFAGASSRQTYTVCESRGGITGMTPLLPNVWLARLAAIDDEIRRGELHLLRLMPLAWLRPDKVSRFENVPTEFGVVSLTAGLSEDGRELRVTFTPKFEFAPKRVVLHVPPVKGLASIQVNGKPLAWDAKATSIELQ